MINKLNISRVDRFIDLPIKDKVETAKSMFKKDFFKVSGLEVDKNQLLTMFNSKKFIIDFDNEYIVRYKPCIKIWMNNDNISDIYGSSITYYFETLNEMLYTYKKLLEIINTPNTSLFIDIDNILEVIKFLFNL